MTPEELGAIAALVLSLAMSYIPGLSDWYAGQGSDYKRLIMLGLLAVVSVGVFAMACAGLSDAVVCDQAGALGLVKVFIAALVANQATYLVSPKVQRKAEVLG
jgi:hypothetical protein